MFSCETQGSSRESNETCVISKSLGRLKLISVTNRRFSGAKLASNQRNYSLAATNNTVEWHGVGACVAIGISMNTIAKPATIGLEDA